MLTKTELLAKASECLALANDPNTPDQYRTYIRLEAQHWYCKAETPELTSYLESEANGLIWAAVSIVAVAAIAIAALV